MSTPQRILILHGERAPSAEAEQCLRRSGLGVTFERVPLGGDCHEEVRRRAAGGEGRPDLVLVCPDEAHGEVAAMVSLAAVMLAPAPVIVIVDGAMRRALAAHAAAGSCALLPRAELDRLPALARELTQTAGRGPAPDVEELLRDDGALEALLEGGFDAVSISEYDPAAPGRRLLYGNERYVEMSGFSRGELEAAPNLDELSTSEKVEIPDGLDYYGAVALGRTLRGVASWSRPDGAENCYEWRSVPIRRAGRIYFLGLDRDITALRRAQRAQRRSDERLRTALDSVGEAVYRLELGTGAFSHVSAAAQDLLGFTPAELEATGWRGALRRVHPEDRATLVRHTRSLLTREDMQGERGTLDYRFLRADGRYTWVSDTRRLLRDGDGRPEAIAGLLRDVTARRRAEGDVGAGLEPFRERLSLLGNMVFVKDADLAYTFVNEEFARHAGREPGEVIGRTDRDLLPQEVAEARMAEERRLLEGGRPICRTEAGCSPLDDEPTQVRWTLIPMRDAEGVPAGLVGIGARPEARAELEERYAHWAALVRWSDDAIIGLGLDGAIFTWNPGAERLYGYSAAQANGQRAAMLEPRDGRGALAEAIARAAEGRGVRSRETVHVRKDGRRIHVALTLSPILDAEGRVRAISATARDVTERKQAEQALRASERRFRLLAETAFDGVNICEWDPETNVRRLIFCNDRYVEMSGYTREQLEAAPDLNELIAFGTSEGEGRRLAERLQAGRPCRGVSSWRRPDGEDNLYEWVAVAIREEGGYRLFGVDRDITEQRRAEEALRENERFLASVFASIQDGVSVLDTEMRIVRVNPTMQKWYAHQMPLAGKKCYQAYHGRSERCERCPSAHALATGEAGYEVVPLTGPGGKVQGWLDLYSFPLMDPSSGEMTGVIEYVRDITERKRAQDQLRSYADRLEELNVELERSNRDLQEFTYTVSHDLQEPLRKIHAFGQFLVEDCGEQIPAEGREHLRHMQQASLRMKRLIQHLLELSRVGTRGREPEPTDPREVLDDVLPLLSSTIQQGRVEVHVRGPLPRVMADPVQLGQVFQNLLSNALKFRSPRRAPRVSVQAAAEDGLAHFRVSDNGIGIEERHLEKVFGLFRRLHPRGDYEGDGVGLALCQKIVRRHEGRIWAESEPGRGSTFHFTLPLAPTQPEDAHEAD